MLYMKIHGVLIADVEVPTYSLLLCRTPTLVKFSCRTEFWILDYKEELVQRLMHRDIEKSQCILHLYVMPY